MAKIGYARVSTRSQKDDSQVDDLTAYGCDKIFTDKVSGKLAARPELDKALAYLRAGDVFVITRLSGARHGKGKQKKGNSYACAAAGQAAIGASGTMFRPISATITMASIKLMPGISASRCAAASTCESAAEPLVTGERKVTVSQSLAAGDDLGRAAPSTEGRQHRAGVPDCSGSRLPGRLAHRGTASSPAAAASAEPERHRHDNRRVAAGAGGE